MIKLSLTTLLLSLAVSAARNVFKASSFPDWLAIHTAENDIVQILVPFNPITVYDRDTKDKRPIFFVEADEGVSVINNGTVKKLLATGTNVAAENDDSVKVYIAATDGLYKYNALEIKAEKYGTVDDNLIGIAKVNGSDVIYVLTEDNVLYKVTEDGTKKEKVNDVVGAKQIVLDYSNNLYYYDADNKLYVYNQNGVKRIDSFPFNLGFKIKTLVKPPVSLKNGIPVIVGNSAYYVFANGKTRNTPYEFEAKPTVYSIEPYYIKYFAYNKKIYEFPQLPIHVGPLSEYEK